MENIALKETYISPETGGTLKFDAGRNIFRTSDGESFRLIAGDLPDFRVGAESMEAQEVNSVLSHLEDLWQESESNETGPLQGLETASQADQWIFQLKTWKAEVLAFIKSAFRGHIWTQAESMDLYRTLTDVYTKAVRKKANMFRDGKLCSSSLMNFKRLSLEPLFELIQKHNIKSVLDFGCGWGANTIVLKQEFPDIDVWSFDYSPYRALSTKFNLGKLKLVPYRLLIADGSKLPLQDNSIDLVFSSHVLEQMNEMLGPTLREVHRISQKFAVHMEPAYYFAGLPHKLRVIRKNYPRDIAGRSQLLGWNLKEFRPANPTWAPTPAEWIVLEK